MTKITDAIASIQETQSVLTILGLKEHAALLDRPIQLLTEASPTAAATAVDWEVTHTVDEAGHWTYLDVYDPERDAGDRDAAPIVNVSMSEFEAGELAAALKDRSDEEVHGDPDA